MAQCGAQLLCSTWLMVTACWTVQLEAHAPYQAQHWQISSDTWCLRIIQRHSFNEFTYTQFCWGKAQQSSSQPETIKTHRISLTTYLIFSMRMRVRKLQTRKTDWLGGIDGGGILATTGYDRSSPPKPHRAGRNDTPMDLRRTSYFLPPLPRLLLVLDLSPPFPPFLPIQLPDGLKGSHALVHARTTLFDVLAHFNWQLSGCGQAHTTFSTFKSAWLKARLGSCRQTRASDRQPCNCSDTTRPSRLSQARVQAVPSARAGAALRAARGPGGGHQNISRMAPKHKQDRYYDRGSGSRNWDDTSWSG